MGLIGKLLEDNKGEKYNRWFRKLIANHEIFCHGYFHKSDEYKNLTIEEQRGLILKTLGRVKEILKMPIWSFGAPENKFSGKIREALKHTSINIWLFGMEWERNNLNSNIVIFKDLFLRIDGHIVLKLEYHYF